MPRVELTLQRGILDEVRQLRTIEDRLRADATSSVASDVDFSSGIFQAIGAVVPAESTHHSGHRELCGYLHPPCTSCGPPETHRAFASDDERLAHAIERTKISTRQYARRQSAWLRRKLLPAVVDSDIFVYPLDATQSALAAGQLLLRSASASLGAADPAAFLRGEAMPEPSAVESNAAALLAQAGPTTPTAIVRCDVCTDDAKRPVMIAASAFAAHQGSPGHRKRLSRAK